MGEMSHWSEIAWANARLKQGHLGSQICDFGPHQVDDFPEILVIVHAALKMGRENVQGYRDRIVTIISG